MWDNTWTLVEHVALQNTNLNDVKAPYRYFDYINQKELDDFNDIVSEVSIIGLGTNKVDGSLYCISSGIDVQFIPEDFHFISEDYTQLIFELNEIPQLHVENVLKGHNYRHPLKRSNANSNRDSELYVKYKNICENRINSLLNQRAQNDFIL